MPRITLITDVSGTKQTLEVSSEKPLLESIVEAGFYIKSSCGGVASCSDCKVKIMIGEDHLNPPSFDELKLLGNTFHITKERLSCQLKVNGPVTVDISHHDVSRDEKRLKVKNASFGGKKNNLKIRKKKEVESIEHERMKEKEEQKRQSELWKEHWKRKPDIQTSSNPKKMGGNRRPRLFKTD